MVKTKLETIERLFAYYDIYDSADKLIYWVEKLVDGKNEFESGEKTGYTRPVITFTPRERLAYAMDSGAIMTASLDTLEDLAYCGNLHNLAEFIGHEIRNGESIGTKLVVLHKFIREMRKHGRDWADEKQEVHDENKRGQIAGSGKA